MDAMIQNNTPRELNFPFYTNGSSGVSTDNVRLAANSISSVSEELFETVLAKSKFFINARSKGEISVLSGSGVDKGVKDCKQNEDALYGCYVELMAKVKTNGGLRNKDIAKFLDGDGMPTPALLKTHLGNGVDDMMGRRFKNRYNIESRNGLHEDALTLPGGIVASPVKDAISPEPAEKREDGAKVYTENELIALGIDEVRKIADSRNIQYRANAAIEVIAKKIVESQAA